MIDVIQASPLYLFGYISFGVIVPSICGMYALFYQFPEVIVRLGIKYQMYKCGMKEKYIKVGDKIFCYGEKGESSPDKPTVVFIHGFTSTKVQWLSSFKGLRTDCHLVAMELPGHGNSSLPDTNQPLDIDFMNSAVLSFLDAVGLADKKVHLVGASLGGAMVGIFSAFHPDRVSKVTMICPAMNTPVESEFLQTMKATLSKKRSEITYEDCVLLPQDLPGIKKMFDLCIFNKETLKMHDQIYQGMLNQRKTKNEYFLKLYKATNTEENLNALMKLAPSINTPAQILWGRHDEIMHYSGAAQLKQTLPNCRMMEILEKCGHALDVDRPGALCKYLEEFILLDKGDNVKVKGL